MNAFDRYLAEAQNANLSDKKTFVRIIQTGLELAGMSLRKAAHTFRTTPGTVSRWKNGHSAPPVAARRVIVTTLVRRVQRIATSLTTHSEGGVF